MEDTLHEEDEYVAALDANVLKWKKDVKVLQSKVKEKEHTKVELQKVSRQQLDAEALIGLQHLENVSNLNIKIEGLASTISQVNRRLPATRVQYEKLKASFPFLNLHSYFSANFLCLLNDILFFVTFKYAPCGITTFRLMF